MRPTTPRPQDEPTEFLDEVGPAEREVWPWIAVLLVLAVAGAAAAWLVTRAGGSTAAPTTTPPPPATPAAAVPAHTVTVEITTSQPPSTLPGVPNVVGQDEKTAKRELHDAGFEAKVEHQPTSDPAQDKVVVGEQPAGGTQAPAKTKVTIYVGHLDHGHEGRHRHEGD